jgi:hypothetical protein
MPRGAYWGTVPLKTAHTYRRESRPLTYILCRKMTVAFFPLAVQLTAILVCISACVSRCGATVAGYASVTAINVSYSKAEVRAVPHVIVSAALGPIGGFDILTRVYFHIGLLARPQANRGKIIVLMHQQELMFFERC